VPPQQRFITRPPAEIYGRHLGYGFAGRGVNTAIGNFTVAFADLTFPSSLLGLLDWTRTYNSLSGTAGLTGPGWTTAFSSHLAIADQVTFFDDDGRVLPFAPESGGGFTSPQDLNGELSRNADGSFTLTYLIGLVWSFDSTGRLTSRSLEGQAVTFDYDANGLLQRAAHSLGPNLTFAHDGSGRVTQTAASDGRMVSYAYAADGTLTSVTVPGGGVTRFQAATGGPFPQVSAIIDADGNQTVSNTYDSSTQQVIHQDFPTGGGADFGYTDTGLTTVTSTPAGARISFQANAAGRMTQVTDPLSNTATFGYDANGRLANAATSGGAELAQSYDASGNVLTSTFGGATTTWTYDDANRIATMRDAEGATTSYSYAGDSRLPEQITDATGAVIQLSSVNGLITSVTNADGNTTSYAYDATGNLISVTNAVGERTEFGYDPVGNLIQQTTPSGRSATYSYDGAGQVTSVTGPGGETTSYEYSPAGLLLRSADPTGAVTVYTYTPAGQLASITDPLDRTVTFGYDADGNLTIFTDAGGQVTRSEYNALSLPTSTTDPAGAVTSFSYDPDGNLISQVDASGTTAMTWDARGNQTSVTDQTGATVRYEYDLGNHLTSLISADGSTWNISYDAVGRNVASVNPLGATSRRAWTPGGNLAAVTDQIGRKVSFSYDDAGRMTAFTDAAGGTTTLAYDQDGHQTSVTTPAGLVTQYRYDSAGRLAAVVDPRGWITRYEYSARGEKTAVIMPSGAISRLRYDPAGQLTEVIDANGSVTRYTLDQSGHITAITDAKDAVTRFSYDADGREISATDALGQTTTREYDAVGNLIAVTDPSGHTVRMEYDKTGRLTSRSGYDGSTVTYTYDAAGRRTSMADATGTTRYTYDTVGQLLTVIEPDGAVLSAAYDAAGRRTSLSYPDGLTIGYSYDPNGRLIGLHDSRAGDAVYALDPDGRLLTEQLPGRHARRYHYKGGLLRRFQVFRDDAPVSATELTRDPDGRILTERTGDQITEFRYDPVGQLVYALRHGGDPRDRHEFHWSYDAVGNRISARRGTAETRYRYDAADQLVQSETEGRHTEYRYDTSGRLTEEVTGDRRRQVEYNSFGLQVTVTRSRPGSTERIRPTFTGDGLLASLVIEAEEEHRDEQRSASARYLWSVGDRVPQILTQRARPALDDAEHDQPDRLDADFSYGYGRTFASWEHGAATFHRDVLGSAISTEDTAAWTQAARYDVFGEPTVAPERDEGRLPELPKFGFLGELALGPMVYLRARTYDAALGRFTTRDPAAVLATHGHANNPYIYCNNDPVNYTDPLGKLPFSFSLLGQLIAFLGEEIAGPCFLCSNPGNSIASHPKCFQKKTCLETRGSFDAAPSALNAAPESLSWYWNNSQPERSAQAYTIWTLNRHRTGELDQIGGNVESNLAGLVGLNYYTGVPVPMHFNVDWEVGTRGSIPASDGGLRLDILTEQLYLFELKKLWGGVKQQVQRQINGYIGSARANYGIKLVPSSELRSWADFYEVYGSFWDFIGGNSTSVYVWGFLNPPGHVYFASETSVPREVEEKVFQENELPFPLRYLLPNPAPNPAPAPAPGPAPGPEPNPGPGPAPGPVPVPDPGL
jgi:RHS repeat-associated protein